MSKGLDYKFKSGLFKNKTVSQVCDMNPDYILNLHDNSTIKLSFNKQVLTKCYKSQFNLK